MTLLSTKTFATSLFVILIVPSLVDSQAPRPNGLPAELAAFNIVQPDSPIEALRSRTTCDPNFRTLNGVCTNPFFKTWGSTNRAQSSLFIAHSSRFPTGVGLPSARHISNVLCKQTMNEYNDRNLNEMATFFGQFIDHTLVATPTDSEAMPILISPDDPLFGNLTNGQLKFTRSKRARVDILGLFGSGSSSLSSQVPSLLSSRPDLVPNAQEITSALANFQMPTFPLSMPDISSFLRTSTLKSLNRQFGTSTVPIGPDVSADSSSLSNFLGNERPINSLTSCLDLSSVYGVDEMRSKSLRSFISGKLKVTPSAQGDLLPLNILELFNAPTSDNVYFLAGDHRSNEHAMLTSLHILFLREHNNICDELKLKFPNANDEILYKNARKINSAQFQKIVFEEYYPAMVGKPLRSYTGFDMFKNPNVLDVFTTAAFRVGHTMVGNFISRRGPFNTLLPPLPMPDMFFRIANKMNNGIEEFLRGSLQENAQEIDIKVQDALRDFLFTGIPEEGIAIDLVSLNVQRGRDHALPTFNAIRQQMGLAPALSFASITSDVNLQSKLSGIYGTVDKVEAWVGMVAENHAPGSSMGPTMNAVWERQFTNLRDGDRFYFRNNIFSTELRAAIPRINDMFTETETLRAIILRNTAITSAELPTKIFFKT